MGMAIDVTSRRPVIGNVQGGLSGPAIKPIALHLVSRVYRNVTLTVRNHVRQSVIEKLETGQRLLATLEILNQGVHQGARFRIERALSQIGREFFPQVDAGQIETQLTPLALGGGEFSGPQYRKNRELRMQAQFIF